MEDIIISQEKADYYGNLIDEWTNRCFESEDDKKQFIDIIKNLLNENENEIEFEAIIQTLSLLTGSVDLKKFRPDLHGPPSTPPQI